MLLAFLATVVIAVGANVILDQTGSSTTDQATGTAVRLGD